MSGANALLLDEVAAAREKAEHLRGELRIAEAVLASLERTAQHVAQAGGLDDGPTPPAPNQGRLLDTRPTYRADSLVARCLNVMRTLNRPMPAPEVRGHLAAIDPAFTYTDHQVGSALSRLGVDRYVEKRGTVDKFYLWELLP